MNILPWLLDWPPTRRQIAVFLVITVFSLGSIAVLGGMTGLDSDGNVTITETDLALDLNENTDIPDTNGSVETCIGSGPLPGHLSVTGEITADIPAGGDTPREVVLRVNDTENRTVETIESEGEVTVDVFWSRDADGTLSVGDTASVDIWVVEQGTAVASTTTSVPVENGSRSYDC